MNLINYQANASCVCFRLSLFKPEIILLGHETREVPFQHLLESDYRLIYQDERQRLYAERATIKWADAAEAQSVVRGR